MTAPCEPDQGCPLAGDQGRAVLTLRLSLGATSGCGPGARIPIGIQGVLPPASASERSRSSALWGRALSPSSADRGEKRERHLCLRSRFAGNQSGIQPSWLKALDLRKCGADQLRHPYDWGVASLKPTCGRWLHVPARRDGDIAWIGVRSV